MIKAENHIRENERIKKLNSFRILDSLPEEDYDNLTSIASEICGTPISLVSLIDTDRQWFKSHTGLDVTETPREYAFCAHALHQNEEIMIVEDAREDERFFDNPLVTGNPHVIFYAGVPLVDEDNLPLGTLCVIDHQPKLLSQSQVKALKALAKQVMNLMELRKTKYTLENSLREMEQVNTELERFAYIAAHDLKSPLRNIKNLTGFLLESQGSKLDQDGLELISLIEKSSDKLKVFIEGLLDYSKSNSIIKKAKEEIDIKLLLSEVKGLYGYENPCELHLHTELKSIFINRTCIEQVFMNLISNSIKYNHQDKAIIDLRIWEDKQYYYFSLKDNGPGIPLEYHDEVFDIFKVLSSKDKFGQRGNGIGLATVKKIIESLGGSIHLDSKESNGAKFDFSIEK